eukprot:1191408-Prorocentrum_minimum.AAC.3
MLNQAEELKQLKADTLMWDGIGTQKQMGVAVQWAGGDVFKVFLVHTMVKGSSERNPATPCSTPTVIGAVTLIQTEHIRRPPTSLSRPARGRFTHRPPACKGRRATVPDAKHASHHSGVSCGHACRAPRAPLHAEARRPPRLLRRRARVQRTVRGRVVRLGWFNATAISPFVRVFRVLALRAACGVTATESVTHFTSPQIEDLGRLITCPADPSAAVTELNSITVRTGNPAAAAASFRWPCALGAKTNQAAPAHTQRRTAHPSPPEDRCGLFHHGRVAPDASRGPSKHY